MDATHVQKAQLGKESMKREFLRGLGLEKETVDKIMAVNGADLEREKAKAALGWQISASA